MLLDYHIHALSHGEYSYNYDWIYAFFHQASQKGLQEIGFTEHDEFFEKVDTELIEKVKADFPDLKVKIGLEVDYIPGKEKTIQKMLSSNNYDYTIGSIHCIDGWAFDHPDTKHLYQEKDIDEVYHNYFHLVEKMVQSGLFNVVGHLDLIKIWGHKPLKNSYLYYIKPVLNSIKESGLVIEINSAGLRKPVKEQYPAREVLQLASRMNIPVTLGSDAHHSVQVGQDLDRMAALAKQVGYKQIASFDQQTKIMVPLN